MSESRTLLLIDDDADLLETWQLMLETLGHEAYTADSGTRGLELYAEHRERIDLVLLDLWMPEIDGAETFARLRKLDGEARVVISSGSQEEPEVAGMIAAGAVGFIGKPFGMDELRAVVERAISPRS